MTAPRIAFYAPMKAPDHPTPSGDRQIARLTLEALELAGFDVEIASRLRCLDMEGDAAVQSRLTAEADAEVARLLDHFAPAKPDLWFTYHCYYKAPDLIGPKISAALGVPYVISEPSISPRRREGPWAGFAKASENAIASADRLLWTTKRDAPALEAAGHQSKMIQFPAFVRCEAPQISIHLAPPLKLLTVAMMRPGDKLESYRRLSDSLFHLDVDWHLKIVGDGPCRHDVENLFAAHGNRVSFLGAIHTPEEIRKLYESSYLFVWPGVGEGVGMVYLEAQAVGLPVIAEDHPAQRDLIAMPLAPPDSAIKFAQLIKQVWEEVREWSHWAWLHVKDAHSLEAAATRLQAALKPLLP